MSILEKVNFPSDIKTLSIKQLEQLAEEIRQFIISSLHKTGGHLGSSLGVVELTIALHKVFDTPKDKLIWDVGHQAYTHKILTGRKDKFSTNRQFKGLSGFLKPTESEYDVFGAGHASTSISAGFGIVCARELEKEDYSVVSIIGDGSITGGLAYEGLNNAGVSKKNFTVILNDNEMSISKNVGAMSKYFTSLISDPTFNKIKDQLWSFTGKNRLGLSFRNAVSKVDRSVKTLLTPGILFERLGFNYIGPVDGHNTEKLIEILENIKHNISGPVLLHVVTEKGKGFKPAEEATEHLHGVSPGILNKEIAKNRSNKLKYQDIFGNALVKLAETDKRIVAITAAMTSGTGLSEFANTYPDRFFDVGIAEGHAITFAAGLSTQKLKPVVAIYSTFLQRAYDHIMHDCALQNLDMVFAIDRAGLVGEDGPTHHGVFDLTYMRSLPRIIVMAPKDEDELSDMLYTSIEKHGLFAIRYSRGTGLGADIKPTPKLLEIGKGEKLIIGKKIAVLAIGKMVEKSLDAAEILKKEDIDISIYNMRFVKPIDKELLLEAYNNHDYLITIEENSIVGGFGSAVLETLNQNNVFDAKVKLLGIPDTFVEQGAIDILLHELKLDGEGIAKSIKDFAQI